MTRDRHEAPHALGDLVDSGSARVGAVLSETGDAAVDDARVDLLHRFVIDTQLVLDGRTKILDDHIGVLRQREENLETFRSLQVEGQAALVTV
jgi:hypothetical protein